QLKPSLTASSHTMDPPPVLHDALPISVGQAVDASQAALEDRSPAGHAVSVGETSDIGLIDGHDGNTEAMRCPRSRGTADEGRRQVHDVGPEQTHQARQIPPRGGAETAP